MRQTLRAKYLDKVTAMGPNVMRDFKALELLQIGRVTSRTAGTASAETVLVSVY